MGKIKVLVTGANGFIGSHLCKKLLEQNFEVIGLSHSNNPKNLITIKESKKFHIINGDINNFQFISELFKKFDIDAICHLAIASPLKSLQSNNQQIQDSPEYQTNFLGTMNLLNAANEAGVKNWIQSSTMSVYNFNAPEYLPVDEKHPAYPSDIYGFTKLLADNACQFYYKNSGFNMIILRYSGVYGIGKNNGLIAGFARQCIDESITTFSASVNRTSDFVFVNDAVNANLLALEKLTVEQKNNSQLYQVFNIGSGEEISVYEAVKQIKNTTNSKCKIVKEISKNPRRFYFDCSKAIKHLKYLPTSLKEGIREYIKTIKERDNVAI